MIEDAFPAGRLAASAGAASRDGPRSAFETTEFRQGRTSVLICAFVLSALGTPIAQARQLSWPVHGHPTIGHGSDTRWRAELGPRRTKKRRRTFHGTRVHLDWASRALFIWLYRCCPRILDAITIVRPETVVRWREWVLPLTGDGVPLPGGRPRIGKEVRDPQSQE